METASSQEKKTEGQQYKCRRASETWELARSWSRNKFSLRVFVYRSYTHCKQVSRTGVINHTLNACTLMCFHFMCLYIVQLHTL